MAHELWTIKDNTMINITPLVGNMSWFSDIDTLGQQLIFNSSFNDTRFFPINPIEVGNLIVLKNESEIFRGILVTDGRPGQFTRSYVCFDSAFYLNKSEEVIQFNGIRADRAIRQLLERFGVPIGGIVPISAVIKKIYNDPVSEILKDILKIAESTLGVKYRMEMRQGKIHIDKQQDLKVKGTFKIATNVEPYDLGYSISEPSRTISIEDMKNSIKIVSDDKVVAHLKSDSLIAQFGLLQKTESVDKKDIAQAKNLAKNMLKELGRVLDELSFEMIGNDEVRAGRLMEIEEPVTEAKGVYLIKSVEHRVEKGIHKMTLRMGVA